MGAAVKGGSDDRDGSYFKPRGRGPAQVELGGDPRTYAPLVSGMSSESRLNDKDTRRKPGASSRSD